MGVVETVLAEFELSDGTNYRVEYNEGGEVHVHVDSMRVDMSAREFREFASVVEEGDVKLVADKELD
ncbi:hypothetical protein [Natronobeatus ordinarius]|uniref:hypothetical protein n=1 Tax=Natronobeatus ordinarius TaxID=2963433 RepID=UPI0020CB7EE8|nr:hypothetical protein [Natronobeatus ordinarius]